MLTIKSCKSRMNEKVCKDVHEIMIPVKTAVKNKQNDFHLAKSNH